MLTAMPPAMRGVANANADTGRPAPKERGKGRAPKYTDAQILEMRSMHEFEGVPAHVIARRFGMDNARDVRRYLDYTTRSRLVPRRPE